MSQANAKVLIQRFINTAASMPSNEGVTVYAKLGRKWFYDNGRVVQGTIRMAVREYRGNAYLACYADQLGGVVVLKNNGVVVQLSEEEFKKM